MPVMNGIKSTYKMRQFLLNEMKIERKNQPLIIGITGHVHTKFKEEGLESGMDKVLEKPCYFN